MQSVIKNDKVDLERLEGVIQTNIGAFYDVGRSLMEIRDRGLYKIKNGGTYQTFDAYCKGTWDFAARYARRLIDSCEVIDNIKTGPIGPIPTTETQTRPLARLDIEQQEVAWQKAVATAPGGKITAAHVTKIVNELTGFISENKEKEIIKKAVKVEQIDPEFNDAWESLFRAVKNLKALRWKMMSRDNALKQIQILIDVIEI